MGLRRVSSAEQKGKPGEGGPTGGRRGWGGTQFPRGWPGPASPAASSPPQRQERTPAGPPQSVNGETEVPGEELGPECGAQGTTEGPVGDQRGQKHGGGKRGLGGGPAGGTWGRGAGRGVRALCSGRGVRGAGGSWPPRLSQAQGLFRRGAPGPLPAPRLHPRRCSRPQEAFKHLEPANRLGGGGRGGVLAGEGVGARGSANRNPQPLTPRGPPAPHQCAPSGAGV